MNHARGLLNLALGVGLVAACSGSSSPGPGSNKDASGGNDGPVASCYGGFPAPASDPISGKAADGGMQTLKTFTCPPDPGPNAFLFSASGEVNAIVGYPYPPYDTSQTWMVDGWNWKIDKYIVVIDHITLWSDPNVSMSDQSMHGAQVAHVDGPFVIDLHKGGPLDGKGGGGEQALAIAAILNQNDNGNKPFVSSQYYAFGFSTVPATYDAINVNLDSSEAADFQYMVDNAATVYYHGTANWTGDQPGVAGFGLCSINPQTDYSQGNQTCATTGAQDAGAVAEAGSEDAGTDAEAGSEEMDASGTGAGSNSCPNPYDFSKLPQQMTFQFAFPTPTNYVNCLNYSLSEQLGMDVRGVQSSPSQSEVEQVTVHMDHPFWESFEEDTPVHWDNIAAQYIGQTNPIAHLDDFKGVPFSPFTDHDGTVMPWHDCEPMSYTPPGTGAMSFSTLAVPIDPSAPCTGPVGVDFMSPMDNCKSIRDYYDFIRFTQSTQGHLNSQGLCYIDRQYPSPAGGS